MSKVVNLLASLLVGIMVARYLGPERYGLMNYVVSFVNLFLIIATFGFDNIEIREEAKHPHLTSYILGTTFVLRTVLSLIAFFTISITAYLFEADNEAFLLIIIYSISVLLTPFDVIRNHFTSLVKNEYIAQIGIAGAILSSMLKVLLLCYHAPLIWFIISLLFDTFVLVLGYCYVYNKKIGKLQQWKFDRQWAKIMLNQSFPLLLSGAAAVIFLQIDQVMIGRMIDKSSVGYFSVASRFVEVLLYIPTISIQTISPILIEIKKGDEERYKIKAQMFMNVCTWGILVLSFLLCLLAYPIILLTFGENYIPAVFPLQILVFKAVGATLNMTSGQILIIDNKQKYFVIRSLSGCIVCILLNLAIIPYYGIAGVAVVASLTQITAGYLVHLLIPSYRYVFKMQTRTILYGWKDFKIIRLWTKF